VIDLALLGVTNSQQDRAIARQVLRLSKLPTDELDSANVGAETT